MDRKLPEYYNSVVLMLSAIGLWPYHRSGFQLFENVVIVVVIIASFVVLFQPVFTLECTLLVFLRNMSYGAVLLSLFARYITYWYQNETIKRITEEVNYIWDTVYDDGEILILKKYTYRGQYYVKVIILMTFLPTLMVMVVCLPPEFVDVLLRLNTSRSHDSLLQLEYFLDKQKYLSLIMTCQEIVYLITAAIIVATESLSAMLIQHTTSLVEIVCYRIEKAVLRCVTQSKDVNDSCKEILITAVIMYNRIIKFSNLLETVYNPIYSAVIVLTISSFSMNLFCLSQSILSIEHIEHTLMSLALLFCELFFIVFINYAFQDVLNSVEGIYTTICSKWYKAPLSVQKLLLFILLNNMSNRACKFTLLIVFSPSVRGISWLINSSISYFMMINSIQLTKL